MRGSTSRATFGTLVRPRATSNVSWTARRAGGTGAKPQAGPAHVARMSSQPKQIGKGKENERYNYNTSMSFSDEVDPDVRRIFFCVMAVLTIQHVNYRRVTATDLSSRREPPTKVKMLVRDFIDDSLYNVSSQLKGLDNRADYLAKLRVLPQECYYLHPSCQGLRV